MGRRTGTQQKWTNVNKIACWYIIQPNLVENPRHNPMLYIIPIMKIPDKLMIFLLYLWLLNRTAGPRFTFASNVKVFSCFGHCKNRSPVPFLFVGWTWIILGVLCNVDISIVSSLSFLGCGEIFDFGILRTIRFETCFLMSITSEPINVIYMHII